MTTMPTRPRALAMALVFCLCLSCNALDLGSVAGLLMGNGVTVVIQNETAFTAVPDIRTSDGRNFFEDFVTDSEPLTNFGTNGAVAAKQTVSFVLSCDSGLEKIAFDGAAFRDGAGLPFGETDDARALRRDVDFDCGDTIRIRLTGAIFNFGATISVDRTGAGGAGFFESGGGLDDDEDDDIADFLDDLFGS